VSIRAHRPYEGRPGSQRPCSRWSTVDGIRGEAGTRTRLTRFADAAPTQSDHFAMRPRLDSNQRPQLPESCALPLRYEGMVRAERFELPEPEGNWVTASPTSPSVARPLGVTDGS
jgi:hypothetical protein